MRSSANDRVKSLLKKVARLEKSAGPGAAVDVFLSGLSNRRHALETSVDSKLELVLDWHEIKGVKGHAKVEDVTLASYYNTKHCHGTVGIVKGQSIDFEDEKEISEQILDFLLNEQVFKKPRILEAHVVIQFFENVLVGGGFTRGKAPKEIEVKGEAIIYIDFWTQDNRKLEFFNDDFEFTAILETSVPFRDAYERLDELDDDEDY